MSNPQNLARPAIVPQQNPPVQQNNNINHVELQNLVTSMVAQALQRDGRRIVHSIMNPSSDQFAGIDQVINPDQQGNISDLDKIPDVVRNLREFSGQPGEFSSWRKSVERILKIYDSTRGSPKYFGIINVIRNKIVGHADHVLESYNTPLNWENISRCLTLHYADKRDLGTLEYQLTSLVQGNSSIQDFYQEVYTHLSLILNKISSMEMGAEALNMLMHAYRDKALDTFIRGLKGDLPRLLGIREPSDLPQALHLCLKLENQNYRAQYAIASNNNTKRIHNSMPPELPPRRTHNNNSLPNRQIPFYPQLAHFANVPRPVMNYNYRPLPFNNNGPRQPPFQSNPFQHQPFNQAQGNNIRPPPRPQPRQDRMETSTIGTARVNYVNRPQYQQQQKNWPPAPKRANHQPQQPNYPSKLQRNFHLNTSQENPEESELKQYFDSYQLDDQQYLQTFNNYIEPLNNEQIDDNVTEIVSELSDIHFLD